MSKKKKRISIKSVISAIVFIALTLSIIFIIFRIVEAPAGVAEGELGTKVKSDYVLMLLQCVLGLVAWMLPTILTKRLRIEFPNSFLVMYFIFLYCAIYLGEVEDFYYRVPHWDSILHIFSGMMLGTLGFSVILFLNDAPTRKVRLSPIFVALFAFCFAATMGVLWEIYEFTADGLLGLNMQKFMLEDKTLLVGRAALADTMKDLIVDVLGALAISTIGYVMIKTKPGWLDRFDLKAARKKLSEKHKETRGVS